MAYARISADLARDGHGVEDQHKVNDETAARVGAKIVHFYTDNDLSAAKADVVRPDFEAMLKVLRAGRMPDGQAVRGAIVVADDRLVRRGDRQGRGAQDQATHTPVSPSSCRVGDPGGRQAAVRLE
ncbi:recombinase family protein [Streptomyces noursei]|uniref:recombinase family protein n=1 Tax=Streptomyces noursei TaxID=1971 RepID=UPI0035DC5BC5